MENNIGITLLRHGRSRADDEGVHEGRYDSPLTVVGRSQAKRRAQDFLAQGLRYRLIITSPLQRAQETAHILARYLNIAVETDTDWTEMDNGPLAGLPFAEAAIRYPRLTSYNPYERIAGTGESEWGLYSRAVRSVENVIQ